MEEGAYNAYTKAQERLRKHTSCLGKVMETMINRRLVYTLEERKLISEQQ
jgi:hypothetical protein